MDLFKLFDNIPILVLITDKDYNAVYVNKSFADVFHKSQSYFIGKKCYKVKTNLDIVCDHCYLKYCNKSNILEMQSYSVLFKKNIKFLFSKIYVNNQEYFVEMFYDTSKAYDFANLSNPFSREFSLVNDKISSILNCDDQNIDEALLKCQEIIGSRVGASRSSLYILEKNKYFVEISEWNRDPIDVTEHLKEVLDISFVRYWEESLFNNEDILYVNKITGYYDPLLYEFLKKRGVQSTYIRPLFCNNIFLGFIAFDNVNVDLVSLVKELVLSVSYLIANTVYRRQTLLHMKNMPFIDQLTKLHNLHQLYKDFPLFSTEKLSCVIIDVNELGQINARFGSNEGDNVLLFIAKHIKDLLDSQEAFVYRIGSDEFCIIRNNISKTEHNYFVSLLRSSFSGTVGFTAAVGATYFDNVKDKSKVLDTTFAVLQKEKQKYYRTIKGTDFIKSWNSSLIIMSTKNKIQSLINNNNFIVNVQPIISYSQKKVAKGECLIRLKKENTFIRPDIFIGFLEKLGLIEVLDFFMLESACKLLQKWKQEYKKVVPLSVNISRVTLLRSDFKEKLLKTVSLFDINLKDIFLEITESIKESNVSDFVNIVDEIRKLGFSIGIDDFGVAYANINTYVSISSDVIKIDKKLVDNVCTNHIVNAFIKYFNQACNSQNIKVVFEGVETEEQVKELNSLGGDLYQGYYFSKPLSVDAFESFIKDYHHS